MKSGLAQENEFQPQIQLTREIGVHLLPVLLKVQEDHHFGTNPMTRKKPIV